MKKFHFIAIGGAAMHNLALALHSEGHIITGSDDEINEPSYSRLKSAGLLPVETGWFPERISDDLDGIILGMHARIDNPELAEAKRKGIPVYSYPEFLYEHSKNKTRVVIGGSHGKTTITAIVLHVLKLAEMDFDYMVGAKLDGFETMVKITDAPVIILEGDEYLSSPVDRRPKFHLYKGNIGLISGIAWDHINVFPTFENYKDQFRIFAETITDKLIYFSGDEVVEEIVSAAETKSLREAYDVPSHVIREGITYLLPEASVPVPLKIFGRHNMANIEGARMICNALGVSDEVFYEAIQSFSGAARRLELMGRNANVAVYRDFAHSPSKLKATTQAVKDQFDDRPLIACMELHTFSSLNRNFLREYAHTLDAAEYPFVYFNPQTIRNKKLEELSADGVKGAFANERVRVYTDPSQMAAEILRLNTGKKVFLFMSSGIFDGMSLQQLTETILNNNKQTKIAIL